MSRLVGPTTRRRDEFLSGFTQELREPLAAAHSELRRLVGGARGALSAELTSALDERTSALY